jgi:hypothetical protein
VLTEEPLHLCTELLGLGRVREIHVTSYPTEHPGLGLVVLLHQPRLVTRSSGESHWESRRLLTLETRMEREQSKGAADISSA